MTDPVGFTIAAPSRPCFADFPSNPAGHFRLALIGVIARILEVCTGGDRAAALQAHPFLLDYAEQIDEYLPAPAYLTAGHSRATQWRRALAAWEAGIDALLPLRALASAGVSAPELELLLATGLAEEDPRFADLFAQATDGERRPTAGLLLAWWRCDDEGCDRPDEVRRSLAALLRSGLIQVVNPLAARSEWALRMPPAVWDALRGEPVSLPWLQHRQCSELLPLSHYIAHSAVAAQCRELPRLLASQPAQTILVRGPHHNGRSTLIGSIARELGKDVLQADMTALDDETNWQLFGALAVMLNALPMLELAVPSGETRTLPPLPLAAGPIAVACGVRGGVCPKDGRAVVSVDLPPPDVDSRRALWFRAAPSQPAAVLDQLARSLQLSSGLIGRAALSAALHAQLDGRRALMPRDVRLACRSLTSVRLERLARRIEARGSLDDLKVDDATRAELDALAARCRHREALATMMEGAQAGGNQGVRALLAGASGTGKTLAAQLLAATLEKDLFRVDLAATVNKYLGETEKSLDEALSAAEEMDVVVLLDEGDSLMASRTDVGSSNDRYANLETNFLLQRIEVFNGIMLITTNAMDRIDRAFARRMDVVISLRAPDDLRRYQILCLHLGAHAIDDGWLQEAACRCLLTGGQLRNVVAHAQLLALQADRPVGTAELYAAFEREYRKTGGHCPLTAPQAVR